MLAQASVAPVTVVSAYPHEPDTAPVTTGEFGELLRAVAEPTLGRMSDTLRDLRGLETRSVADRSPARALQEVAREQKAGVIVVGSSHTGRAGRVLPGSTAERLLHGSPCPVAVVTLGFRSSEAPTPRVIACAWDGRPESDAALGAAEDLARERLRPGGVVVVNVGHPETSDALEATLTATLREVFPHVARDPIETRSTLLVAAANEPLAANLRSAASRLPRDLRPIARAGAERLAPGLQGGDVYTDDRAPVEWLIDESIVSYAAREK